MSKITKKIKRFNVEKITLFLLFFSTTTLFSHSLSSIGRSETSNQSSSSLIKKLRVSKNKVSAMLLLPSISIQPSTSSQNVCFNTAFSTLSITASNATMYEWYKNEVQSNVGGILANGNSSTYLPVSNVIGTSYYYCVVRNDEGSVTSNVSGSFIVLDYPNPGDISGIDNICTNGISTYTSDGDSGGYWTTNNSAVATIGYSTGVISPVGIGSTVIFYTALGNAGCPNSKALKTITVSSTLNAGVINGSDYLCSAETPQYTSTGDSGGTWASSNTSVAVIDSATGELSPQSAGSTTITYTVSVVGCDDEVASKTIVITAAPNAGIVSGDDSICKDNTTVVTTDGDLGGVWSSDNTSLATVDATTGTVTGVSEGLVGIRYSLAASGACPVITSTKYITVEEPVNPGDLLGTQIVCPGHFPKEISLSNYNGAIVKWQRADNVDFTGATDIAITNDFLAGSDIGYITETTYFRAQLSNLCGIAFSNEAHISVGETTVWDGTAWSNGIPTLDAKAVIAGVYDTGSQPSFEACSCDVLNAGQLIIQADTYVLLDKELFNDNLVTIKSNGSLIQIDDTVVNTEAITVERHTTPMTRFDFTYWSSPVVGEQLVDLATSTLFYSFNTSINTWTSVVGSTIMLPGKGYIARAPQAFSTTVPAVYTGGMFFGVPNNGIVTVDVINSESNKWNLIGNPYPSALNIEDFLSYNSNELESTIFLWTHNTPSTGFQYSSNDYASYNALGGIKVCETCPVPSGSIASGQAFFVGAKTSGTVTYTNSMRDASYNNGQFYRTAQTSAIVRNRFWLNLTNNQGAFKQALIGYVEGSNDSFDGRYSGVNFNANNFINFYSINNEDKLSIQGRTMPFDSADIIPLGYTTAIAGTFQIKLDDFDGLFTTQNIYLKDYVTQTVHNLTTEPYTFTTATGAYNARFEIQYQASPALSSSSFTASNVVVYKDQDAVVINAGSTIMDSVKVFDIQGRLLYENNKVNQTQTILKMGNLNQVVILQITTDTGIVVTKKVML